MWGGSDKPNSDAPIDRTLDNASMSDLLGAMSRRLTEASDAKWNEVWDRFGLSLPSIEVNFPRDENSSEADCTASGGTPVQTEEGKWKCLFKDDARTLRFDPSQFFKLASARRDLFFGPEERKEQPASNESALSKQIDQNLVGRQPQANTTLSHQFPGEHNPVLISEAESIGKPVASRSFTSETYTADDGTLKTVTKEIHRFQDNTAVVKSSTTIEEPRAGWFWK